VPIFVDSGVSRGQRGANATAVNLSFQERSHLIYVLFTLMRLSGPVPDPLLLRKSDSAGNRTRDPWVCS
jgi:hypothetical protein